MSTDNRNHMAKLAQQEDYAYFQGELCLISPESFTPEEKRQIALSMLASSKAVLDAMRADFEERPKEEQDAILTMLYDSADEEPEWWHDVLVGDGDPLYSGLDTLR